MVSNNTTYLSLCDRFFSKIKDYDLASMSETTATEIAIGYIPTACLMFESCNQDLDNRDDVLGEFCFQLSPTNVEILTNFMVINYIDSNYLRTSASLKARLSSNDFKSLNLQQQLSKVMELRSMLKSENDQLAINKSYKDSELFNLVLRRK